MDYQKNGKIKSIGVSNFGIKHLKMFEKFGLKTPSVNQIENTPFCFILFGVTLFGNIIKPFCKLHFNIIVANEYSFPVILPYFCANLINTYLRGYLTGYLS